MKIFSKKGFDSMNGGALHPTNWSSMAKIPDFRVPEWAKRIIMNNGDVSLH